MKTIKLIPLLLAIVALISVQAKGQTLTVTNFDNPTVINSFITGSGGLDGYDFVTTSADSLPAYVSSVSFSSNQIADFAGSTEISINGGTPFNTGVAYLSPTSTYQTIATIDLTGSVSPNFTLGILQDNSNATNDNSLIQLALFNSDNVELSQANVNDTSDPGLATPSPNSTANTNGFFLTTVSGAATGDYIEILAKSNPEPNGYPIIGGVTFETASVPEPTDLALSCIGLGVLAILVKKRSAKA